MGNMKKWMRTDSSSRFQQEMEKKLYPIIQKELGLVLLSNPRIPINAERSIFMQPDFYSREHQVIGEIHIHAGRIKGSQPDKIAADILKMLLHDKTNDCNFTKYIVVCSQDEYDQLTGNSALAEAIRQFDIHVMLIPLENKEQEELKDIMKKQSFL